ncbi:hypothetical protein EDB80DRAFT_690245 [Ilyonectria destructans]|nr:hypothetical protein EDB80DRAFT_690245 [Ilyonectria destructans]
MGCSLVLWLLWSTTVLALAPLDHNLLSSLRAVSVPPTISASTSWYPRRDEIIGLHRPTITRNTIAISSFSTRYSCQSEPAISHAPFTRYSLAIPHPQQYRATYMQTRGMVESDDDVIYLGTIAKEHSPQRTPRNGISTVRGAVQTPTTGRKTTARTAPNGSSRRAIPTSTQTSGGRPRSTPPRARTHHRSQASSRKTTIPPYMDRLVNLGWSRCE